MKNIAYLLLIAGFLYGSYVAALDENVVDWGLFAIAAFLAIAGVVIAKRNHGLNSAFTVRKLSHGEGVERVFQTYSPSIADIKVKRRGKVRRAKLYYLRGRTGKAARIKEKL